MVEIVGAVICGTLAALAWVVAVRSLCERGPLWNNAYLWASEQERAHTDKRPLYRQTGVAFLLVGAAFACLAVGCFLRAWWTWIPEAAFLLAAVVYAIVSSVRLSRRPGLDPEQTRRPK